MVDSGVIALQPTNIFRMKPSHILTSVYDSPCGGMLLGEFEGCLCMADWLDSRRHDANLRSISTRLSATPLSASSAVLTQAAAWLDAYFIGIDDAEMPPVPSLMPVGSPFRLAVWSLLLTVPYGHTCSYASLALKLGRPSASRAVASAVGDNPLSIFIPCHRVIGADGSLTGYAGGIGAKRYLLDLESAAGC